jgi:hypothetical protein
VGSEGVGNGLQSTSCARTSRSSCAWCCCECCLGLRHAPGRYSEKPARCTEMFYASQCSVHVCRCTCAYSSLYMSPSRAYTLCQLARKGRRSDQGPRPQLINVVMTKNEPVQGTQSELEASNTAVHSTAAVVRQCAGQDSTARQSNNPTDQTGVSPQSGSLGLSSRSID